MSNQQADDNEKQQGKPVNNHQDSGSDYIREHAGNVPDYGMNFIDPNAKDQSNINDKTND
jgi:hypothetical protein